MASPTLLVAAASSAAAGAAFLVVGWRVTRSPVATGNRAARRAHACWWAGLGAYLLLQGGLTAAAAAGALTDGAYRLSRLLAIPLLCAGVWGLATHLVFLRTGSRRAAPLLAALYAGVAALFAYATFVERPPLEVRAWVVGFEDSSLAYRAVYALVGLPPILASLGYLALLRHARDPAQRRRIRLTSLGILAYVGGGLAGRLADHDLAVFLTLVPLGLLSAAAVLAAHAPPRPAPRQEAREGLDTALAQRLRDLL